LSDLPGITRRYKRADFRHTRPTKRRHREKTAAATLEQSGRVRTAVEIMSCSVAVRAGSVSRAVEQRTNGQQQQK